MSILGGDGPYGVSVAGMSASGASVGWVSPNGSYTIVPVIAAVIPPGWTVTGNPTYAVNEDGSAVVETAQLSTSAIADMAARNVQRHSLVSKANRAAREGRQFDAYQLLIKANGGIS